MSLFGFMFAAPYEQRKVGRYEKNGLFISTAAVNDGAQPYETAVEHPKYNEGHMVIVEAYDTKEAALAGHERWVKRMTSKHPPTVLLDCNNSEVGQLGKALFEDEWTPPAERQAVRRRRKQ